MGKFTSSTKSKARNMLKFETPAGQDHTTGNAHRKLGEVWTRGFWYMFTNRHTHRPADGQTDMFITILPSRTAAK